MDRTEAQLREKLLKAEFEPETVEQAIAYVYSYGYLDDESNMEKVIKSAENGNTIVSTIDVNIQKIMKV